MTDLLIGTFRYFQHRRISFFLLFIVLFTGLIFLASQIGFEEDISRTVSGKPGDDLMGYVVKNLPITDKIIVDISSLDSLTPANPEVLELMGRKMTDSLSALTDSSLIKSITFKVSDSMMVNMMEMVTSHLPSFLDEADYIHIDSMIRPDFVTHALNRNYRMLISPASMVLKKRIEVDPLGISNLGLEKLKSFQAGSNFEIHNGCIFSLDLRHLLIFIAPANTSAETSQNDRLIRRIDEIIRVLNVEKTGLRIQYFGGTAVAVANAKQVKRDIALTLFISVLLIFSLVGWYYNSIRIPLLGLLPAVFGAALAMSILFLIKGKISAISLGIGSVLLGLIVDYSLYLVNHCRNKGDIELAIREMWLSIVICSLTTMGAFLCLTFLNSAVLQDLGWFAAMSVAGAAVFTLVFLPQLLGKQFINHAIPVKSTFIDTLAGIHFEEKKWLIALLLLMGSVSLYFAGKTTFETNMASLSYVTPSLARAEQDLDRISNYRLKNLYFVSTGKTIEQALVNKEKMKGKIRNLMDSGIINARSDAGYLLSSDSLQRLKIERWNRYWTPEKKARINKLVDEEGRKTGFRSTAFHEFEQLLNKDFSPVTVAEINKKMPQLLTDWLTITDSIVLTPSILQSTEANKPKIYQELGIVPHHVLFDRQSLTNQFIENVRHDFDLLVLLSMVFVTLLLIVSFGRLGLGLLTALPMFFSWLITLGFMGLTGIKFNIFNIIISSFIFGLGVDYSILMMRGLQQHMITGNDELKTYKVAIILSSLTTLFGVGALFFARHPALRSIALVSVVGMLSVVVTTFVFQPLIFNKIILSRAQKNRFPVTFRILIKTLVTWGNIVAIAMLLMVLGWMINILLPISRKTKELLFHHLFYWLTKAYIAFTFACDRKLINEHGENFQKPAIIISNHQSLIETPAFLRLYPKMIILTTSWVYRSPVFGPIARLANFYNVDLGLENIMDLLKEKVREGFSILIFPEGHRSEDHRIQRFHRGAFYLAEQLRVDILPIVVFGTGDFLGKGSFWGRPNSFIMKILNRVAWDDNTFGSTYQDRSKAFRRFYIQQYALLKSQEGTVHYYRRKIALNYVLKGPVLEWYMRVKLRLENNYELYHKYMPVNGEILDLGCGYGFMTYMLMFTADERTLTGVDYDAGKIEVAQHCWSENERIDFVCGDVTDFAITPKAGFILSDVLHYLERDQQEALLRSCFSNLIPGGTILIREANADLTERHKRSGWTEFFSTRTGFNKTATQGKNLYFTTGSRIQSLAQEYGMNMEVIDNKNFTSNILFVIRKQAHKIMNNSPGFHG